MASARLTAAERDAVVARANSCCEYCGSPLRCSPDPFSIEHILPRARAGTEELSNLALSCQGCNGGKYTHTEAIDPVTGETVPLFNPRSHVWAEHFTWGEDFTLLVGLTPTGRATVEKLRLNRPGVVNLRRMLRLAGEHPAHPISPP